MQGECRAETRSSYAEPQPSLAVASQMQRQSYNILKPILLPEVAASCQKQIIISIYFDFCSIYTIFAAEGTIDAARKAVAQGNKVYILPNPKGITLYNPQVLNISSFEDSFSIKRHICTTE